MSRPATARLKVNPPLGRMPVLQFVPPAELSVDPVYQRSLDTGPSQTLIRRIAQFWNWDLCQPLVVSRRRADDGERFFVIDGQHRLEAAKLRADIAQMPCVVVEYTSAADEAASFVHLNQQRRPLTKLDVFKAAVASEDPEAMAIVAAMADAGLTVAPHSNYTAWKPGMVSNIGGIERVWRSTGEQVTRRALSIVAEAWRGEVLRYAGTIFPGVVHVAALIEVGDEPARVAAVGMLRGKPQAEWARQIMRLGAEMADRRAAAKQILLKAWTPRVVAPAVRAPVEPAVIRDPASFRHGAADEVSDPAKAWCSQCDRRVTADKVGKCLSPFCPMKARA